MLFLRKNLSSLRSVFVSFAVGLVLFSSILVGQADAAAPKLDTFIAADGSDLTAVVQCLPSELSEGNLDRAVRESFNSFLEKTFRGNQAYDSYQIDETEANFLTCLELKGVTPQVKITES